MKSSNAPLVTLVALLSAAVAVLVGGALLSKRETTQHDAVGREEVSEFAGVLVEELRRLDALYENHLVTLSGNVRRGSEIQLRAAGDHLIGLRQISIVPERGRGLHAEYPRVEGRERVPLPVLAGNKGEAAGSRDLVELEVAGKQGWVGDWFYHHRDDLGRYVVFAIDRAEVQEAIHGWVGEWFGQDFEPVAATGAVVRIDAPTGAILAGGGTREPDFVLPVKTRYGRWKLSGWDEVSQRFDYHPPTLAAASAMALGLALLGIAAFYHQRKWQRLAEQRVSFVNRVSHELRTPLTNILLNTDLANDAMETRQPEAKRRLGLAREEAGRLSRLIGNVLSFSKNEGGELELKPSPFGLEGLTEIVLGPFRPALRRRGIEVELDIEKGVTALGDADACAQILSNLVSNVEKYAAGGGWLEIAAGVSSDGVWLSVSDRGQGIPEGKEELVFGAFERLGERVDEGVTGTGLGLAIARDLARRMGGDLRAERRDGGARFVLELPAAPENVVALEQRDAS